MRVSVSKTKAPKFTGMKKNHAAVFIGQCPKTHKWSRIRIIHSQPVKVVGGYSIYEYIHKTDAIDYKLCPCWAKDYFSVNENIKRLKEYDVSIGLETVFLGYVRDEELI